jgi:hypothetical protein
MSTQIIEVRVPLEDVMKLQHEVLANIKTVEKLRAAGIPVVGKLVLSGITHGTMTHRVEEDLDGDTLVYEWSGEVNNTEDEL